jgi:hypothetical protein
MAADLGILIEQHIIVRRHRSGQHQIGPYLRNYRIRKMFHQTLGEGHEAPPGSQDRFDAGADPIANDRDDTNR